MATLSKDSDITQVSMSYTKSTGETRERLLYSGKELKKGKPFSEYLDKTCLEIIDILEEDK